jgi:4'-phosphopantetheinyl transferase
MLPAASCLERGGICAYVGGSSHFADNPLRVTRALSWMTGAERERYHRFRHDRDRAMFGLGREMARTIVADALGIAPDAWTWRDGPHGRPEIASPATDLHFNLSHSAGIVICAVARRAVGVDIEDLSRRAPDPAIVSRYCSPDEAADVRGHGEHWPARFLTYWTLKEAYLKARGLGIAVHLSDISFSVDAAGSTAGITFRESLTGTDHRWAFHLTPIEPHHLAAVAVQTADGHVPALTVRHY